MPVDIIVFTVVASAMSLTASLMTYLKFRRSCPEKTPLVSTAKPITPSASKV